MVILISKYFFLNKILSHNNNFKSNSYQISQSFSMQHLYTPDAPKNKAKEDPQEVPEFELLEDEPEEKMEEAVKSNPEKSYLLPDSESSGGPIITFLTKKAKEIEEKEEKMEEK